MSKMSQFGCQASDVNVRMSTIRCQRADVNVQMSTCRQLGVISRFGVNALEPSANCPIRVAQTLVAVMQDGHPVLEKQSKNTGPMTDTRGENSTIMQLKIN